jgi:translation initiation factor 2B subunit (eIF-2B alpha/beta/delta family)
MNLINIKRIADDIKTITIQGATNIAKAACKVMEQELRSQSFATQEGVANFVLKASQMLIDARETEPLLRNGMKYAKSKLQQ